MNLNQEFIDRLNAEDCKIIGFADLRILPEGLRKDREHLITGIIMGAENSAYPAEHIKASLDRFITAVVQFLEERGYEAKTDYKPLKMLGTLSGIGWIGKSAMLTTKTVGPALRLNCVLTDAPFECGTPIIKSLCPPECMACTDICPANAIKGGLWEQGIHRDEFFDVDACIKGRKDMLCGAKCISVCPFNQ